ncbi:hypothetical protein HaLaN_22965, partial [Haematococcus lacustris]
MASSIGKGGIAGCMDLQYIMNHAADELLLADITFLPQLQR